MSLKTAGLVTFALGAFAFGCRTETGLTELVASDEGQPVRPMIVAMGGFNSCVDQNGKLTPMGMDLDVIRRSLDEMIDYPELPTFFRSCYDKSGTIYWQTARQVEHLGTAAPQTTSFEDLAPMVEAIVREHKHFPQRPVFIVGHSHGGWLAMKTALILPASVPLAGVVTNDPISRVNCGVQAILWQVNHNGCQEAPQDVSDDERGQILARISGGGQWRHYYQRNFAPLRSAAFAGTNVPQVQVDLSPFLSYYGGGTVASMNAHTGIDNMQSPWIHIRAHVQASAPAAAPGLQLADSASPDGAPPRVTRAAAVQALGQHQFQCGQTAPAAGFTLGCSGKTAVEPYGMRSWRVSMRFDAAEVLAGTLVELVP